MRNVIAELRTEHANMERLLRILDQQIEIFEAAGQPDYTIMQDIILYFLEFPDRCHHPKEGEVLGLLEKGAEVGAALRFAPFEVSNLARAWCVPARTGGTSMSCRVPASDRTREALSDLIAGRLSSEAGRSELVPLATRLIIEEGLEAEVRDALGRDYYERGAKPGDGYRNGLRQGHLKTAEGFIEYGAPQVVGRDVPFRSELRDHLKGHSEALENLAIEMLARGLSVRDIEDAFKDESGRLLLSRTAVSELGARLWADYEEFSTRDLSEYDVVYLFVDGIAERIRPGQRREPVLAAWGFTAEGKKVLLALMAGSKEDTETVSAFFQAA